MKEKAKNILYLFCGLAVLFIPVETFDHIQLRANDSFLKTKSIESLLEKRTAFFDSDTKRGVNKLVNILIVPGHDDEVWGAEYKDIKEVELNRTLASRLHYYLSQEEGINAMLASDESGYNQIFEEYFEREKTGIEDFIKNTKETFSLKLHTEEKENIETNFHNVATDSVIHKLYGINRWVNVQDFDLVIHIHFNDYPRKEKNKAGKHTGFSIYTPGKLFDNYELSRALADSIFEELKHVQSISTLKSEKKGVIETHELIALGANESLNAGSILIEYGYVYEDAVVNKKKREATLDYFAYATYAGIKKLLNEDPVAKSLP